MTSDAPSSAPAAAVDSGPSSLRERFTDEVVLITGFPGFRAQALVRTLVAFEPSASLWLIVPPAEMEHAARLLSNSEHSTQALRLIPGEPCAIDLGLSRQVYAELAQRVDRWFALYQTTHARASRELCFRVNLGSAREVVELSRVAEQLAHVTFLSSNAVFGDRSGVVDERDLALGQGFTSAAGESLALAEAVLQRALAEVPVSIVRTGQLLGERGQGQAARASGLHRLLALVAQAPSNAALPLPPGSNRAVQALPADFVAQALYAVSALGTRGRTYHFADPDPPALAEVLEQAAAYFGKRFELGFDARLLGRLLLKSPGYWLSQQSSGALSEWAEGAELSTRGGDRLLERAGLRAPSLLGYLDSVLRETEALLRDQKLDERRASQPFEVVA